MLAKNFNIKYICKVGLFIRHRNNKNFKAERVYLDDILQNIPEEKKKEKIADVFLQKMIDYGFENEHYVFLVYDIFPYEAFGKSNDELVMEFHKETQEVVGEFSKFICYHIFYDDDTELIYCALGYLSSLKHDSILLDRYLNRFIGQADEQDIVNYTPFYVRGDAKVVANVYDDRGMDIVLSID